MSEPEPALRSARLTERQSRIADRLDELSETLGDIFRAAVRETQERQGKAWIRLAAHACRELVTKLPDYFDIPVTGARLDYAQRFRQIAERWPENLEDEPPEEVIRLVVRLVRDDRATSASIRARARTLFSALEAGDELYAGDAAARAELWVELQRYFPKVAHVPAPDVPDPDPVEFERYFIRLERLLASQFRAEGYYETQADLDQLLEKEEPELTTPKRSSRFCAASCTGASSSALAHRGGCRYLEDTAISAPRRVGSSMPSTSASRPGPRRATWSRSPRRLPTRWRTRS